MFLCLSCCGAPLPRETTATNARLDDHWLDGERCPAGPHDDAGLGLEELTLGTGKTVGEGETVRVHYVARLARPARLPDGTALHDTTADGLPVEIVIGSTRIICGFERALVGMRAGGQRRATVPWRLAFGEAGRSPDVQPRADLVFVIDLFVPAEPGAEHGSAPTKPPASRGGGGRPGH